MEWRNLPTDLVEDILSRIPAITLARFRSTSKQWSAILKSTRLQIIHSTLKTPFLILHKLVYLMSFTARACCYAPQRTRDLWFGIHVQGKPRMSFLADKQSKVVRCLNSDNVVYTVQENKHIQVNRLGRGKRESITHDNFESSSVLLNYAPSLTQTQQDYTRKRKSPST
ncbi:hypothetical protein DY000_02047931 [Brassica cretica]|uniref:F-box domain-containing protein n=1 Tax=Brassica cretica TaxID=69181 RepID=A0ABQ7F6E1_BRACR|nr:hypothetical protein DY000_02047931 [Brassica cretica]